MNVQSKKLTGRSKRTRAAFTLIELLVVISAIAVLASLAVGMIASAQEDARASATRARVQLIEKLMEVELENYEIQRSPVPFRELSALVDIVLTHGQWNSDAANFRLHVKNLKRMLTLDLIRAEIPDARNGIPTSVFPSPRFLRYLGEDLMLTQMEINQVQFSLRQYATSNVFRWNSFSNNDPANVEANSAEILYRVLTDIDADGTNGIDVLGNAAVGDTDGDQFLEVVDAWGDPLRFEFHQRTIVPAEFNPAPGSAVPMRSGIWEVPDPGLYPGTPQLTDFNAIIPNLPSEIRFFVTSDKLLEIDGAPVDFISSDQVPPLQYQFP